ncbi:MAG: energy transducer TonB [Bacteroidetes bacterium]|nr:energy transducer TonB [Bacteroidota bacterium]MBL0139067.1 energy transducer TonB [Bacteroidota bacterium]
MKKDKYRKPESFVRQPNYPGGNKAIDQFIKENLRYPEEAVKNKIEGTVSVEFDLDAYGQVTDARLKHGIGYGCDEEAIRLVKLLKYEKKIYKGLRVIFHKNINIHFRLTEVTKLPEPEQTVKYQYTENKKPGEVITYSYKPNT